MGHVQNGKNCCKIDPFILNGYPIQELMYTPDTTLQSGE